MKYPKIIIPISIVDTLGCVYKLHYKDKYIIVMGKSMWRSVDSINQDLGRFHNSVKENSDKNNLYRKFYEYIVENPGDKLSIEMITSTDNAYQLLKHCQIELDKGRMDDNCLNSIFGPYINRDIQRAANKRKANWWINRGSYLNFLRWKKLHSSSV